MMLDAGLQIALYYNVLLLIVVITAFYLTNLSVPFHQRRPSLFIELFFLVLIILFIGVRDWDDERFIDSVRYGNSFMIMTVHMLKTQKDYGFALFVYVCKTVMNVESFFIVCATLYISPLFLASKRLSSVYAFYFMLFCVTSMSFFAYGTNGIRNGIATSFILLAFTYRRNMIKKILFFIIAISFHASVILPIFSYIVALYYKQTKVYFFIWLGSIMISLSINPFIKKIAMKFDFISERGSGYFTEVASIDKFSMTGFRWDFLLYSSIPILLGCHFVLKKKFSDNLYILLLNTYIIANTFWILIIDVPFSNRFAYLSWFLMPILIIYPFLKYPFIINRSKKIAFSLLLYFGFTYLLSF